MKEMKIRLTFIEELLGSSPADEDIYRNYVASHAPDAPSKDEEVEALGVDGVVDKGITIFPRTKDGRPLMWDYQIKGMFKNAQKALNYVGGKEKLPAYKSKIDNLVFVKEREIPIVFDGEVGVCQRPLRASTAQGERVALAISESCPAGATMEFTVMVLADDMMERVIKWLDYGKLNGLGQWHNSGKGRFEWRDISDE